MREAGRWTIGLIVVAMLLAAVAAVSWRIGRETAPDCPRQVADGDLLLLVNEYRAANGLGQLTTEPHLQAAAQWMAEDLVGRQLSHEDSLGRDLTQRLADFGYPPNTWRVENIGSGQSNATEMFEGWKNSPAHNETMLNPFISQAGIGNSSIYWVFDGASVPVFQTAKPAPPPPEIVLPTIEATPTPVIIEPTPCG